MRIGSVMSAINQPNQPYTPPLLKMKSSISVSFLPLSHTIFRGS